MTLLVASAVPGSGGGRSCLSSGRGSGGELAFSSPEEEQAVRGAVGEEPSHTVTGEPWGGPGGSEVGAGGELGGVS